MERLNLNGEWMMKRSTDSRFMNAVVPGSVTLDYLRAGLIDDPFYRDNELVARALSEHDYEYVRKFFVDESWLSKDRVYLVCEGLDTLASVEVNGSLVARTDNMHRRYRLDVSTQIVSGENEIRIVFSSPMRYIEEKQAEYPLWGPDASLPGFPHLRKAHYMFGWDWGPIMPDMGIWRDIYLEARDGARLSDVYVTQRHGANAGISSAAQPGPVDLSIRIRTEKYSDEPLAAKVVVTSPDGSVVMEAMVDLTGLDEATALLRVENPQLWWPNGIGDQPLYEVTVVLQSLGRIYDQETKRIGLRTLTVRRDDDQWGESFEFVVNGVSIFARGANYIPEDNLIGRTSREKTERLIADTAMANHNCIRVWGGGYYPNDYFYDLCDEYGLIVWQDFMFACGVYHLTEEFAQTIRQEAIDNVRRLRHHACIGIWCGNNEMEQGWVDWNFPKPANLRTDYLRMFEILLPDVMKEEDPETFYWPASPSSGGGFVNPNDENSGDVHYWQVWHGQKPFTEYRKHYFRFCSEFGFQSFPEWKTVKSFTAEDDRNPFSRIMEWHQRSGNGNGTMLLHLSQNFRLPKDMPSLLYASQVLQAESIQYGVEHWRRNLGRCMGSIYWQLNDCWPVASWSSIDSLGRWKALHYFSKRFYNPLLISALDEGEDVSLHVTNERLERFVGQVQWALREADSTVVKEGHQSVEVEPMSSISAAHLRFHDELKDDSHRRSRYLEFSLYHDGELEGVGCVLFVKPKHFEYRDPKLRASVLDNGEQFVVTVESQAFANYVALELKNADALFSDNYFHLSAGSPRTIYVDKARVQPSLSLREFANSLEVISLYEMSEHHSM